MPRDLALELKAYYGVTYEEACDDLRRIELLRHFFSLDERLEVMGNCDEGRAFLLLVHARFKRALPSRVEEAFSTFVSGPLRPSREVVVRCLDEFARASAD